MPDPQTPALESAQHEASLFEAFCLALASTHSAGVAVSGNTEHRLKKALVALLSTEGAQPVLTEISQLFGGRTLARPLCLSAQQTEYEKTALEGLTLWPEFTQPVEVLLPAAQPFAWQEAFGWAPTALARVQRSLRVGSQGTNQAVAVGALEAVLNKTLNQLAAPAPLEVFTDPVIEHHDIQFLSTPNEAHVQPLFSLKRFDQRQCGLRVVKESGVPPTGTAWEKRLPVLLLRRQT
ncbi:MAG: hypothetical protein HC848_00035 [Limnobacter sp.]|nr:hypothetical protein [Limnobacter sp.]